MVKIAPSILSAKFSSLDKEVIEVDQVKRSESGMILDPVTIESNKTIQHAMEIMNHFNIITNTTISKIIYTYFIVIFYTYFL